MDLTSRAKRAEKFVIDNSPMILTGIGVAGLVTTAVLSGRAAVRADRLIMAEEFELREPMPNDVKAKLVWKEFVPPVAVGTVSIACIVGSNRVSNRRAAALAAAYTLSEKAMVEYKAKVLEKFGEKREHDIKAAVAEKQVRENPPPSGLVLSGNSVLCYDSYSGRYFESSAEAIQRAVNGLNHDLLGNGFASLNDFYIHLGLEHVAVGDEVGWTAGDRLLELNLTAILTSEDKPCLCIEYNLQPVRDYYKFGG